MGGLFYFISARCNSRLSRPEAGYATYAAKSLDGHFAPARLKGDRTEDHEVPRAVGNEFRIRRARSW